MSNIVEKRIRYIYIQITSSGKTISEGRLKLPVTVGRDASNTISFTNALAISRRHLIIEQDINDLLIVRNLSKNGYLLNDKQYFKKQELKENDIISFLHFSKSIKIQKIYKSLNKDNKEESRPGLTVYHSQSKILQLSQIFQQRIRKQLRTLHILYLIGIIAITSVLGFLGYFYIRSNNSLLEKFKTNVKPQIIVVQKEDNLGITGENNSEDITQTQESNLFQPPFQVNVLPNMQQLIRNFKQVLVEIVLDYNGDKIAQNGFFHNGLCYSPFNETIPINELSSAWAYFVQSQKPVQLTLNNLSTPFFRFVVKNNDFIPLAKTVETDLTIVEPEDNILLLEFRRKNNLFLFTKYTATVFYVQKDKITCKYQGEDIRLGSLAVSFDLRILGLVTDIDRDHTLIIESMDAIDNKLDLSFNQ